MNKENLLRLADFLDKLPQEKFDMYDFAHDDHRETLFFGERDCMTVGCAVGWAPAAGIPVLPEDTGWHQFSERVFGLDAGSEPWSWCFGQAWARRDNTPAGAAARIRHLVNNGLPADAEQQRYGEAPRSYA